MQSWLLDGGDPVASKPQGLYKLEVLTMLNLFLMASICHDCERVSDPCTSLALTHECSRTHTDAHNCCNYSFICLPFTLFTARCKEQVPYLEMAPKSMRGRNKQYPSVQLDWVEGGGWVGWRVDVAVTQAHPYYCQINFNIGPSLKNTSSVFKFR